ncbi:hypothetical protein BS78_K081500 [Paspalum vaginatum]|uniref:Uncharacterized protein n=1 Tax=Paspalum vaginatum TaxID=158149 RepID=A0A9W7XBK9_9POAL|nr:hypothetical protein BS78_K081500 [Paspalum vaginatum]
MSGPLQSTPSSVHASARRQQSPSACRRPLPPGSNSPTCHCHPCLVLLRAQLPSLSPLPPYGGTEGPDELCAPPIPLLFCMPSSPPPPHSHLAAAHEAKLVACIPLRSGALEIRVKRCPVTSGLV